jgi:hypothetical protein
MPITLVSCLLLDKLNPNSIPFTDLNTMAIFSISSLMEQGASEASIVSLIKALDSQPVQDAYQAGGVEIAIAKFKEMYPEPDYVGDILTAKQAREMAENDANREVFGVQEWMI